jgi:hypothetical protein
VTDENEKKLALCPVPGTASPKVALLFRDIVLRCPAGSFSLAHQSALLTYSKLTVALEQITAKKRLGDAEHRRANRIAHTLRSLQVRLGLKHLEAMGERTVDVAVAAKTDELLHKWQTDESHPRFGLMGVRVAGLDTPPTD